MHAHAHARLHTYMHACMQALGRASKESEVYYPQLLSISIAINVPSYLNFLWPVAKRFMPAKSLAKFRICTAKDTTSQVSKRVSL